MSYPTLPVATIPVAAVPTFVESAPEPVTPEEAAAIARRIRVQARLPRVTLIGTILGLVVGVAAIWPFLDSQGYMADVLVRGDFGAFAFIPGWLLAGLLPLLAFYAGRLHFQTGRSSTGELEVSLRKIRRVILGCMFASITAVVFILAQERQGNRDDNTPWLSLLYFASFGGCVAIIGDVRRGLGDFDSEHQRRRRKLARGFTVELRPLNELPTPAIDPPSPPQSNEVPFATRTTAPPPLPTSVPVPEIPMAVPVARALPVAATVAPALDAGEDDHLKDLRLLMLLAVITAVVLHAVRMGENLSMALRSAEYLAATTSATFSGTGPGVGSSGPTTLGALAMLASFAALVFLIPCGVMWVIWGLLALNYGPAFRRTIGWLAIITLVLAIFAMLPAWLYGQSFDTNFSSRRNSGAFYTAQRLGRAPEVIHCLFVGLLLTRLGVKRLMTRSSASDDDA